MCSGKVSSQVDTPTALYDRPANAFVASFIGSPEMNIQPATLSPRAGAPGLQLGGQWLPLPAAAAAAGRLACRRCSWPCGQSTSAPCRVPPASDSTPVSGTLRSLEHMGNEVFVHFAVGSLPLTARLPPDQLGALPTAARGSAHTFHLQMAACHLFHSDTGVRLC